MATQTNPRQKLIDTMIQRAKEAKEQEFKVKVGKNKLKLSASGAFRHE